MVLTYRKKYIIKKYYSKMYFSVGDANGLLDEQQALKQILPEGL